MVSCVSDVNTHKKTRRKNVCNRERKIIRIMIKRYGALYLPSFPLSFSLYYVCDQFYCTTLYATAKHTNLTAPIFTYGIAKNTMDTTPFDKARVSHITSCSERNFSHITAFKKKLCVSFFSFFCVSAEYVFITSTNMNVILVRP